MEGKAQTDSTFQVLKEDGTLVEGETPQISSNDLLGIYRKMVTARALDETLVRLQRTGRIAIHPPNVGEEAVGAGACFALAPTDWLFSYYRCMTGWLTMGMSVEEILDEYFGNERSILKGTDFGSNLGSRKHRIFPHLATIAVHMPEGVGFALAAKLRRETMVVLEIFGDGATSRGDFHESLNFAGVFKVPAVFVCQNDQWAISLPFERQTATKSIAFRAEGYGFDGVRVDGNDVLAVYSAVKEAVMRARRGDGPTLIDAITYRIGPHTTSDDSQKYRAETEVEAWRRKDPVARLQAFLTRTGVLDADAPIQIRSEVEQHVKAKVKEREQLPKASPESVFQGGYSKVPWHINEELGRVRKSAQGE